MTKDVKLKKLVTHHRFWEKTSELRSLFFIMMGWIIERQTRMTSTRLQKPSMNRNYSTLCKNICELKKKQTNTVRQSIQRLQSIDSKEVDQFNRIVAYKQLS